MANFIKIDEDKFKGLTIYKQVKETFLKTRESAYVNLRLGFRRIVQQPDIDGLVFDINLECKDWLFLRNGKVILLVDGEAIEVQAHESYAQTGRDAANNVVCRESDYYKIDKALLKKICDSKTFEMKVYAGKISYEVLNPDGVVLCAKLFYNGVYDSSLYTDSDASQVKSGNGCLGLFALLISLAGGTIAGLCSLM